MLLLVGILSHLVGGVIALTQRGPLRAGRALTIGGAASTAAAVWLLVLSAADSGGVAATLDTFDMTLGRVGALLLVVITATATVVAAFSARSLDNDGRAPQYFFLIGVVATGSALVVVPATPVLLIVGWLVSGWALVGLVGFERALKATKRAQRRILTTLAIGDAALIGAVIAATATSDGLFTGNATNAVAELEDSTVAGVAWLHVVALLVVVAGASRSALVPFHRWLIGTLAAPTPVSALVHAGLVSGAGLLLLRFAPAFVASEAAVILAFVLGVITVIVASSASILRSDIKGSLAWSTVAQMAFMVVQCAVGAFSSAVFHIAGHGMYKATLFLGSGDTAAGGLRAKRRAIGHPAPTPATRLALSALAATASVALAIWLIPPEVSDAGRVLVVVFAWLSIAFGISGWLQRGPLPFAASAITSVVLALAGAFAYVGSLRLVEEFLKPSFAGLSLDTVVGATELIIVLAVLAAALLGSALIGTAPQQTLKQAWIRTTVALTSTAAPPVHATTTSPPTTTAPGAKTPATSGTRRAEIRAEVARASRIVAPQWPLASFVAVNPLGGLESMGFEEAAAVARKWLGAKTHLSLDEFRKDHRAGLSRAADLEHVVYYHFTELCEQPALMIDGHTVSPVDIIVADLLHGPEAQPTPHAGTTLQRHGPLSEPFTALIDSVLASWLAAFVEQSQVAKASKAKTFVGMCLRLMAEDPRLSAITKRSDTTWLAPLAKQPAAVIDISLQRCGVVDEDRPDELRGHLSQLPGWTGLAKWRNEWAQPDEGRPPLAPIEVVAVRAALEAVVIGSGLVPRTAPTDQAATDGEVLDARVDAVAKALAPTGTQLDRDAISSVIAKVPAASRPSLWLAAQERNMDERLLSMIDRLDPGPSVNKPDAQLVFCIDVRSEGLRRHLEAIGNVETIGFAGFFGVPMRIRRVGWEHTEARCPVLVSPAIEATEHPRPQTIDSVAKRLTQERVLASVQSAHKAAKYGAGAPFALAETAGWLAGPTAALKTLVPPKASPPSAPATRMVLDDDEVLLEQRVFFAEAVLNTMGLTKNFAALVMLCGHTSNTVNNPHATALECGACAGASGDDNARAVAALLNSPDVRHGLVGRGITIPDETWFVAGLHDTASDHVALLDTVDAPAEFQPNITDLASLLAEASARNSHDRSTHLPGPSTKVRDRGSDWAQVRPEWGLARNAAFVIGPRSVTADLDLEGRCFLHTYNAEDDPTGRVLETIMTAPLVVGHWISSQYYFSTVDPEVFGAGNKLLHNPLGTTGVVTGDGGDLRVGLPLQSTHVDGQRFHQPVRLLAVIQADLERIESIVAANPVLQALTEGSWLRLAARSHPHERWSTRTPKGTWVASPRPLDPQPTLTPNTEMT